MGEPDESCEICRRHGLLGHDVPPGISGMVILEMGPLNEILRCSCPLCAQLHFEPFDPHDDPAADEDPEISKDE
jgi:hypothetical protein